MESTSRSPSVHFFLLAQKEMDKKKKGVRRNRNARLRAVTQQGYYGVQAR